MSKNILYVAENAISPIQGGGIVVHAALKGLPPSNLLGFYRYASITPAPEYVDRFHLLPAVRADKEVRLPLPSSPTDILPPLGVRRFIDGSRARIRSFAGLLLDRVAGSDLEFVGDHVRQDGFRPDFVFVAPLSLRILRLGLKAAESYRVPIVMLNMDDWMSQESALLGPLAETWRGRIARVMKAAKPHVAYAYSNSARLADVLMRRYGILHETMNNASPDLLAGRPDWTPPPVRKGAVITFAGALNWNLQGQTLLRVAEAVAELRRETPLELRIFAPWEFAPLANMISVPGSVVYCGFRSAADLVEPYLDSDFLLATTTFLENRIHLFRHSLATKLSDYLCVGRPVISVGHADWAVHEYVEQHRCGTAIRTPERHEIKRRLLAELASSPDERHAMGRRNRRLWETAHDVEVMAKRLRSLLEIET